jgi:hypothetical protein
MIVTQAGAETGHISSYNRQPLAKALGVRRSYVWRILKRLPFDAPLELLAASPITPGHVIAMRQRNDQFRRQQDGQARREAEDWNAAWREEEARAQRDSQRLYQSAANESNTYLDDPQGRAWRDEEDEVRRIMFPWLYKDKKF